ncbi:MAG: hypothetical protein OEY75_01745, partial [Hylemonella sp.]|nr:hypothetical protein [Hylemonella sp.]
ELRGPLQPAEDRLDSLFTAALAVFRLQQWEQAEQAFAAILVEFPLDGPSKLYLERSAHFRVSPAATDWDGVFNRLDK